jgi:hypothetical protein
MKGEKKFRDITYGDNTFCVVVDEDKLIYKVHGVKVIAVPENNTFATYFENIPEHFKTLYGIKSQNYSKSIEQALWTGIIFILEHSSELIEKVKE